MPKAPVLRLVLGDQLTPSLSSLSDLDPGRDPVLMAEVEAECRYVRHHPKKIALVLSAMRHFADELQQSGVMVDHIELDDPDNRGNLKEELCRAVERLRPERVVVTAPGEWRLRGDMDGWAEAVGCPVEIRADERFLCSLDDFAAWADGRKSLRMEYFYRELRARLGLLMTAEGEPEGGRWNFDRENRRRLPGEIEVPPVPRFAPDATTRAVLDLVAKRFPGHFGDLEPFELPVTRADAERAFESFVTERLACFGDYQDAMRQGEEVLFHSLISPCLNIGLLDPLAVCRRVERAYREGAVPLNAAEGFIRQVAGWREFVRGVYWTRMPEYARTNALQATRPLPAFYWTGETDMNCLRQTVEQIQGRAYAHHIQRLMVTGNFALLAGLDPAAVNYWYMVAFADAYEWVELPNVQGMALFADGGVLASKPYAASGKYIDRMSDYCGDCRYNVRERQSEDACPFNFLYWSFLIEQQDRLRDNPRMAMVYRHLDRLNAGDRAAVRRRANAFFESLTYAKEGEW